MWALGCHPQITSYEPFAHETRVASYWATLLQELMDPNCYLTQFDPADLAAPRWWLGDSGNHRPIVPDGALARWLGRERVPALAAMAQAQIDDFYIANADAGADVTYFVEKFSPWQMLPDLLAEIYPRAREIILVRDFRDMFCSIRAYNAKRGQQGFGRDGVATESEYIREIVRGFGLTLLRRWRAQPERAYLLRYEDLIAEPNGTLSKLLKHLDLDAGPATVEGTLAEASRRRSGSDGHRTAPDVASSVGRWRRDLSPELLKVCEEALDPVLDEFGYERTSPHVAERA